MRKAHLDIDTAALIHNLSVLKSKSGSSQVIAMVKANAYGCGLDLVGKTLASLVDFLGVACLEEALVLRHFKIQTPCMIFEGPHQAEELQLAQGQNITWVLHHLHQVEWIMAQSEMQDLKLWIKVNTGMNRLGFQPSDVAAAVEQLQTHKGLAAPIGLMTHFACADLPHHPLHLHQLKTWQALTKDWQGPLSACNSAGLWSAADYLGTHVRLGLALYGVSPFAEQSYAALGLKPVMHFHAGIIAIYPIDAHQLIGYGASYESPRPMKLAIIGIGYGDGYPRHIKDFTKVSINGYHCSIVGRVSMDKLAVDITDTTGVQLGDLVELWGDDISLEYVASQAGTIPYELMTQVGPRERLLNLYLSQK